MLTSHTTTARHCVTPPLQVTHDVSHLTCADFLRAPGVQTPVIVRFSTVIHERCGGSCGFFWGKKGGGLAAAAVLFCVLWGGCCRRLLLQRAAAT